jgi:hypothetical protein
MCENAFFALQENLSAVRACSLVLAGALCLKESVNVQERIGEPAELP